jgi:signal transduction histidine kinase/ActR/RegA family two-component response regulator
MDLADNLFHYFNAVAALVLAAVAAGQARRGGGSGGWGAAAFAALAVVLLVAAVSGDKPAEWVSRLLICVLLAFPYLLVRFTASFGVVGRGVLHGAAAATVAIVLASLIIPSFPEAGAPQPGWYAAYLAAVLVLWTALSGVTIVGLWRGGAGQPTLTRRRTRLMSAATAAMNILILLAPLDTGEGAGALTVSALLSLSLAGFAVGFAPPRVVRVAWRQPEQEALRRATEKLVGATTVGEVTDTLLPHVARLVGGTGAAVCDADGSVLASFGDVPALDGGVESRRADRTVKIPLSPPFGTLVVATSPVTPFFGREELALLQSLAALADLSLARCALSEREHDNQEALRFAKQEAERANAAKSDFLSRMSHELRTPLNVVLGFGQILEMRGSLDARDGEAVEHILKAGRHLLELINEVLDLSTIESGRMAISPEPVEVAELAREALDLIRPLADERSVRLTPDLGGAECHFVTADRQRLKQVVLNLLSNAVKYNHDGGEVSVSCTEAAEGRLRLLVADTGPGVPEGMVDRLFEPFERLGAEQGQVQGTGLGLALSRQLVELMGGEIGVESREGEGSVFWVELAVARAPDEVVTAQGAASNGAKGANGVVVSRGRRLLLVEDNLANLKVIESVMSQRAHVQLLPAMTGRLGLALAREHRPDLILLDQHLPDVTGAEVLQRLKADPELRDIPVVVVSADATASQVRRMRALGAADYLTKPLDMPVFLKVVDGILDEVEPAP